MQLFCFAVICGGLFRCAAGFAPNPDEGRWAGVLTLIFLT